MVDIRGNPERGIGDEMPKAPERNPESGLGGVQGGEIGKDPVIHWENYNFPPCLHVVHFSLGELQGALRRHVLFVYLSYTIMLGVLGLNRISLRFLLVLSTIIQAAAKYSPSIEVCYTFLSTRLC